MCRKILERVHEQKPHTFSQLPTAILQNCAVRTTDTPAKQTEVCYGKMGTCLLFAKTSLFVFVCLFFDVLCLFNF